MVDEWVEGYGWQSGAVELPYVQDGQPTTLHVPAGYIQSASNSPHAFTAPDGKVYTGSEALVLELLMMIQAFNLIYNPDGSITLPPPQVVFGSGQFSLGGTPV